MSSVYKRPGRKHYYMEFIDQHGIKKTNVNTKMSDSRTANQLANQIEGDAQRLRAGLPPLLPEITLPYLATQTAPATWSAFVAEYTERILDGLSPEGRRAALGSLHRFDRIMQPKSLTNIGPNTIADFVARRRKQRGKTPGSNITAAAINKDLRHLKAALRAAAEWHNLKSFRIRFEREEQHLPRYVIPEHFAAIYAACEHARFPRGYPCSPTDWWQALIIFIHMTSWRISATLSLPRTCVNLENGTVFLTAATCKGKRDSLIALHPLAVDHLRQLGNLGNLIFPWNQSPTTLWDEWVRIQQHAQIDLPCHRSHPHTPRCHFYGFHDLRRAFATENADRISAKVLQELMQHKCPATTDKYINMGRKLKPSLPQLYVPNLSPPAAKKDSAAG